MAKLELPVPIHILAFLQAYLYEIFSAEKQCESNFKYTEWYFGENYSDKEVEVVIEFFKDFGVKCDCDVIRKLDLREISEGIINYHN